MLNSFKRADFKEVSVDLQQIVHAIVKTKSRTSTFSACSDVYYVLENLLYDFLDPIREKNDREKRVVKCSHAKIGNVKADE